MDQIVLVIQNKYTFHNIQEIIKKSILQCMRVLETRFSTLLAHMQKKRKVTQGKHDWILQS
jgi:hypothetical protein